MPLQHRVSGASSKGSLRFSGRGQQWHAAVGSLVPPRSCASHAQGSPCAGGADKKPALVSTLLTVMTFVILIMLSQWLMGRLETARPVQSPPPPVPASESPSTPTSSAGLKNVE